MDESNGSDNSSRDSIDDRVALMSRKFKQMIKKKGNLPLMSSGFSLF